MKKENLYEPFSISFETLDAYTKPAHKNTFFELVYIIQGTGTQHIQECKFKYNEGYMFLLTPADYYRFEIETTTKFFYLRFNDTFIKNSAFRIRNIERLEFILHDANHHPGSILENKIDKNTVRPMIAMIIREFSNKELYYKELIQQLVNTLIVIVARNISKFSPLKIENTTEDKALDILQYIQNNIYYPEKIKAESIGRNFKISAAYLGKYFKSHTGETMQQYINHYKIKVIQTRLKFSDKRINEIAREFGFSDESHFNKFFRKQIGINPTEYRKTERQ